MTAERRVKTGICTFCGHSTVRSGIEERLEYAIDALIVRKSVHCFYIGNHGDFDRMALVTLKRLRTRYPSIEVYVVLAYRPEKKRGLPGHR